MIEERDDVLQIAAPKRRKAVSRRPWKILAVNDSAEALAQKVTLERFYNGVTATNAIKRNQRGGFRLLVQQMMRAIFDEFAVHEIIWNPQGGQLTAEFKYVPLYFFENTSGALRYIGPEGGLSTGKDLAENEWMTTVGDSALMKAASICYMFKRFSLQDWLNFSEKFGIPGIHGETTAPKGSPEWDAFVNALDDFANDWVIATNVGAKINLIEAKQVGSGPFAPMVERMDRRLASLCRGADLSTLSAKNHTGASLQGDEQDILIEDDCALIAETLQTQVSRFVIGYQHDTTELLAYIHIEPPVQKDVNLELAVDQFLLNNDGELGAAETYERYSRVLPTNTPEGKMLKRIGQPLNQPSNKPEEAAPEQTGHVSAENDATAPTADELAKLLATADFETIAKALELALGQALTDGAKKLNPKKS